METINIEKLYKRGKSDRDIFTELMPYKIKEVLLVANYYDSFMIEREGQFTNKVLGEYLQVNLYTSPRFTSVLNQKEALKLLKQRHFDLVIIMAGLDRNAPVDTGMAIKAEHPKLPQILLVVNAGELTYYHSIEEQLNRFIERTFVWNGSASIFFAICKYLEDKMNIAPDTQLAGTGVILLVENSIRYYSRYLPLLYTEMMNQTQQVISKDATISEMALILKIRVRPKVILVSDYESAIEVFDKYKAYIIGVISDVSYFRNNQEDEEAGFSLVEYVKSINEKIKCLVQSHDAENEIRAKASGAEFINKNSPSLSLDIKNFIKNNLGFGKFFFRDEKGQIIDTAESIEEFKSKLLTIPDKVLLHHALRNDISTWLLARAEINLAKYFRRYQVKDFKDIQDMRAFIQRMFAAAELKKLRGRIINFAPELIKSNKYILRMSNGSLGGKGRGMAFLCNFIENTDLKKLFPEIRIQIPISAIIGVDEYDLFIEENNLMPLVYSNSSYETIKEAFLQAHLSSELCEKLRYYLQTITTPLAVRSSGLFEDSYSQPFAGVYSTYIIPNNHPDIHVRLEELSTAIKLIYASIYKESTKEYFKAGDARVEDEKMAIILQEVVGKPYGDYFYPNISGVAQSYNYYPFSYLKPEDGFAVLAVGLGAYVVGGEKTYRFCPRYPKLQINAMEDAIRDSQKDFMALDLKHPFQQTDNDDEATLVHLPLKVAEEYDNLVHCAEVYDFHNERVVYDFSVVGPRIVNFANILQYNQFPLAPALDLLLTIFQQAMGAPVEMEFAVELKEEIPTLYLLQIKPLIQHTFTTNISIEDINPEHIILKATQGMGNGEIDTITDMIYVKPSRFDKLHTNTIAEEIRQMNEKMEQKEQNYILIGPGRWGTRDSLTGIPVKWSDISQAKVIVELGLKDFPLEASLGSHFFHNVTSMQVGYFAIPYEANNTPLDYDFLKAQEIVEETEYVRYIRFAHPLKVLMDGRTQTAVVLQQE